LVASSFTVGVVKTAVYGAPSARPLIAVAVASMVTV